MIGTNGSSDDVILKDCEEHGFDEYCLFRLRTRSETPGSWVLTFRACVFASFSPQQITISRRFLVLSDEIFGIPFLFYGTNYQTVWFCGLSNKPTTRLYQSNEPGFRVKVTTRFFTVSPHDHFRVACDTMPRAGTCERAD